MPLHMAGTEIYVHTLATFQKNAGHEVAVLTPFFNHYPDRQFKEHYVYDGIDVYQYMEPSNPLSKDFFSGNKIPEGIEEFKKKLELLNPDIIHFHELTRSIGLSVAHVKKAKKQGSKVVLTMHLSAYTCNTNTLINHNKLCNGKILEYDCSVCSYKTMFKLPAPAATAIAGASLFFKSIGVTKKLPQGKLKTLVSMPLTIQRIKNDLTILENNIDKLVSLTEWYKKILLTNGVSKNKITVIPQGLATISAEVLKKNNGPASLPIKIIFIGRIQPQKGVDLLIDAIKEFNSNELLVDIYGKREETTYYHECIKSIASNAVINFKGPIERENVLNVLTGYDVLCLPSTFSEMSPLVIQEAFAAGIPVLASNVYGNAEQVQHGKNGWLFIFKDKEALKKQIAELIKKPELINIAKQHLPQPNSFVNVAQAYTDLYNEILSASNN
jgi:glycosyltransferase involved in cell wall biosynthesis